MHIQRLDPLNEPIARRYHRAARASQGFGRPHYVGSGFDTWWPGVRAPQLGAERFDLLAVDGQEVLGGVMVWLPTEDNLQTAWIILDVAPEHRRRGIGAALLAAVEAELPATRTELVVPAHVPADHIETHPYRLFAERVGYRLSSTATARRLPLPVASDLLDRLEVKTPGYRILSFLDGVPEQYLPGLGVLRGLVDVDAPTGDLDWEPSPLSPKEYADELRRDLMVGGHQLETIAVHEASGEVAAFTLLQIAPEADRPAGVGGTLVRADHRGHRLGMAVKIANLRALNECGLAPVAISTENDDTNAHMTAINVELGFEPVEAELIFARTRT